MKLFKTLAGLSLLWILSGCSDANLSGSVDAGTGTSWRTDFDAALKQAKEQKKPVLVDFFASWCGPCKMMEKETFPDPAVVKELKNWITVKIDVDREQKLARKFNVEGIPTMILLNPEGQVIATKVGYMPASELVSFAETGRQQVAQ